MLQPVLLPTADENKRQYPIDFMLERRISHPWTTVSYWCRQQIFENNPQFNKIIGLNNGNLNNLAQIILNYHDNSWPHQENILEF